MTDKQCPRCSLWSSDTALRCDCGYDFETGTIEESYYKDIEKKIKTRNQTENKKYLNWFAHIILLIVLCLVITCAPYLFTPCWILGCE